MRVFALIKDCKNQWIEDFKEGSTVEDIKNIIVNFNASLRPGERRREFVKLTEPPEDRPLQFIYFQEYVIGKKVVGGYVPIKSRDNGSVMYWVKREFGKKISKLKTPKKVSLDDLRDNKFDCPLLIIFIPTEWPYTDSTCQKCPMIFSSSNTQIYYCRYKQKTDKKIYC